LSLWQNHRIRGLLEKCTLDQEARMETLHNEMRERAFSDAKWRQIQQNVNQSVRAIIANYSATFMFWPIGLLNDDFTLYISYYFQSDVNYLTLGNIPLSVDSQPVDLTGEEVDALRGKFIRRLTAVITHHIPAFWKVALSVFSGKFAKVFWTLSFFLDFNLHYEL